MQRDDAGVDDRAGGERRAGELSHHLGRPAPRGSGDELVRGTALEHEECAASGSAPIGDPSQQRGGVGKRRVGDHPERAAGERNCSQVAVHDDDVEPAAAPAAIGDDGRGAASEVAITIEVSVAIDRAVIIDVALALDAVPAVDLAVTIVVATIVAATIEVVATIVVATIEVAVGLAGLPALDALAEPGGPALVELDGDHARAGARQRQCQCAGAGSDVDDELAAANGGVSDEALGPLRFELVPRPAPTGGHDAPSRSNS